MLASSVRPPLGPQLQRQQRQRHAQRGPRLAASQTGAAEAAEAPAAGGAAAGSQDAEWPWRAALVARAAAAAPAGAASRDSAWPRRAALVSAAAAAAAAAAGAAPAAPAAPAVPSQDDYRTLPSGLKVLDVRAGEGATPAPGQVAVIHWAAVTKGYQGKRIDNTSLRDEPYSFVVGSGDTIKAIDEAVTTMRVGGIRRLEVPGERPELSYARDRAERFTNELRPDRIYKYRVGPQPAELGGQRALDFVLDDEDLQPFNRTLLIDIKLLAVRRPS